jgi:AbrB family looped-hinge helix DNA binding protein
MSEHFHTKLKEGGRLVIPSACRKRLNLKPGDDVVLELRDDAIYLTSTNKAIAEVQALVRRYIPTDTGLVDELIQDRRDEAEKERKG